MNVKSPCINICVLDERTGLCKGCLRSEEEIVHWLYYSDEEKREVLERLKVRSDASSRKNFQ